MNRTGTSPGGQPSHRHRTVLDTRNSREEVQRCHQSLKAPEPCGKTQDPEGFNVDSTSTKSKVLEGASVARKIIAANLAGG